MFDFSVDFIVFEEIIHSELRLMEHYSLLLRQLRSLWCENNTELDIERFDCKRRPHWVYPIAQVLVQVGNG